jgi:protein-S-isoprenylcysteine O-methyltransferase Ste14
MIKPGWCFFGVLFSFAISSIYFFQFPHLFDSYFFITIYLLITYYTIIAVATDKETYLKKNLIRCLPKALGKYVFWGLLIFGACTFYNNHPFYKNNFPGTVKLFQNVFTLFLYCGFPYFVLAEKFRSSFGNYYHDPYLRFLSLLRLLSKGNIKIVGRRIIRGFFRQFFLSLVFRVHYIAIMVDQIYFYHKNFLGNLMNNSAPGLHLAELIPIITALAWSIDANNASMGYFWESDFTKTRFKGIDPFPTHWFVTLICYHPFNTFAYTFLPYFGSPGTSPFLFEGAIMQYAVEIVGVIFLLGYIYAGSSLNFSCSNLSYKKIQTRGLYRIVRHPATFFKMGYLFILVFKLKSSWALATIAGYIIWTTIYILRTICEERYLKRFQEYRDYMEQTKYRIIPGLF